MQNVCIFGVGLIGGSLGMALRRVRQNGKRKYRVWGTGRSKTSLKLAMSVGALDETFSSNSKIIGSADIVVLCVPVDQIPHLTKQIFPFLKSGVVLTDVGSVKGAILTEINRAIARRTDIQFVGGHPLAGSEKSGVKNAHSNLFNKAQIILTQNGSSSRAFKMIKNMWEDTGGHCISISAADHDKILSLTSHLPHLISFALFWLTLEKARKDTRIKSLVAGSFRDMTRIAASDPYVWAGILALNRKSIRIAAKDFLKVLNRLVSVPRPKLVKVLSSISQAKRAW